MDACLKFAEHPPHTLQTSGWPAGSKTETSAHRHTASWTSLATYFGRPIADPTDVGSDLDTRDNRYTQHSGASQHWRCVLHSTNITEDFRFFIKIPNLDCVAIRNQHIGHKYSLSGDTADQPGAFVPLGLPILQQANSGSVADLRPPPTPSPRGAAFWLVFLAVCVSVFLSALDLTIVPTALPTIVSELNGTSFAWVGNAYTLAASAWLPLSGALATALGRQPVILGALLLFVLGSIISGEATSMTMLIVGRAVQGLGAGGIISLTEIIVADLVPLRERGLFMGLTGMTWAFASTLGAPLGGVFAQDASWRWIFRMNIPITFVAFCLVAVFLRLKRPTGRVIDKLKRIDWFGNLLVALATTAVTIALTRGGVDVAWSSAATLVPLLLGLGGIIAFFVMEARWVAEPSLPFDLISNRTSLMGYIGTFLHSIIMLAISYFLPVYFQACKDASPVRSGVDAFGLTCTIAPAAIASGVSVVILKRYVPQNYIGWAIIMIGCGLLSTLRPDSSTAAWVGFEVISGIGLGLIYTSTKFPILAPIAITRNASAMALFAFSRVFAQTFGITIGSAVLQNKLQGLLPAEFIAQFPAGVEIAFAAIPVIPGLSDTLRVEVQEAFALSLSLLWKVLLGFCGAGLLSVLLMKEIALHTATDADWDMSEACEAPGIALESRK